MSTIELNPNFNVDRHKPLQELVLWVNVVAAAFNSCPMILSDETAFNSSRVRSN